jgi:hypothetical protein
MQKIKTAVFLSLLLLSGISSSNASDSQHNPADGYERYSTIVDNVFHNWNPGSEGEAIKTLRISAAYKFIDDCKASKKPVPLLESWELWKKLIYQPLPVAVLKEINKTLETEWNTYLQNNYKTIYEEVRETIAGSPAPSLGFMEDTAQMWWETAGRHFKRIISDLKTPELSNVTWHISGDPDKHNQAFLDRVHEGVATRKQQYIDEHKL